MANRPVTLTPKAPPRFVDHDPHGFHGQTQNPSRTVLEAIGILHRAPERAGVVFIDSNAGARLMRTPR